MEWGLEEHTHTHTHTQNGCIIWRRTFLYIMHKRFCVEGAGTSIRLHHCHDYGWNDWAVTLLFSRLFSATVALQTETLTNTSQENDLCNLMFCKQTKIPNTVQVDQFISSGIDTTSVLADAGTNSTDLFFLFRFLLISCSVKSDLFIYVGIYSL